MNVNNIFLGLPSVLQTPSAVNKTPLDRNSLHIEQYPTNRRYFRPSIDAVRETRVIKLNIAESGVVPRDSGLVLLLFVCVADTEANAAMELSIWDQSWRKSSSGVSGFLLFGNEASSPTFFLPIGSLDNVDSALEKMSMRVVGLRRLSVSRRFGRVASEWVAVAAFPRHCFFTPHLLRWWVY